MTITWPAAGLAATLAMLLAFSPMLHERSATAAPADETPAEEAQTQEARELFPQLSLGDDSGLGTGWQFTGQADDETVAADAPAAESAADAPAKNSTTFRDQDYVVQWTAWIDDSTADEKGDAAIVFRADPDAGFHVYASSVSGEESSTGFVLTDKAGLLVGAPETKSETVSTVLFEGLPPIKYHEGDVTWRLPVTLTDDAAGGDATLQGMIIYQACTDTSCRQPMALKFAVPLKVDAQAGTIRAGEAVRLTATSYGAAADEAATIRWVDRPGGDDEPVDATVAPGGVGTGGGGAGGYSLVTMLLFAFIGGIILNVMPCVLPVVGLKVMSFVQQGGEDRRRVFMLNMVYALGILSVFVVLAALAVGVGFSWGQQFTFFPFKLGLTLVLFALALSYFGVWEIPVPGMAAGKTSQELQSREGYPGAFAKGIFATVLATPCSGPLLGSIFGLSILLSGPQQFLVMMTVGLGMALPYVIIGLNPKLVAWLPKPGGWMETFKEFLAFFLLGTVAFFFAGFKDELKLPVFVSLIGVWFGCWIIGRVPSWDRIQKRTMAWIGGLSAAAVIGFAAFATLSPRDPGDELIAWEPYNESRLQSLQAEGRTVMLDFTASWCVNCKINTAFAIDTEATKEMIEQLDAVPMLADWSDRSAEIKEKLTELNSNSIPLLVIYPGSQPDQPIILRDLVSQSGVLAALEQAGPSVAEGVATKTDDSSSTQRFVTTDASAAATP